MSTIKAFIRVSQKRKNNIDVAVRFRLSDGRSVQLFYKSNIYVDPEIWDSKKECIKAKVLYSSSERTRFDNSVTDMKKLLREVYESAPDKESLTSDDLALLVDMRLHPEKYDLPNNRKDFFTQFDRYVKAIDGAHTTQNQYAVTRRSLQRFEQYKSIILGKPFKLEFDKLDATMIGEFENFLREEHKLYKSPTLKQIFVSVPSKRPPEERGSNSIVILLKKVRAFIKWANKEEITNVDPFRKYSIKPEKYGTPIFITIDELNKIANADLKAQWEGATDEVKARIPQNHIPQLEIQRDIFVFQSLIGCRVGDLYELTPSKFVDGSIQYIARKTKGEDPKTISVPLNNMAKEILSRYYDGERKEGKLLPFISEQRYNDAIKDIFTLAGITRMVTILDPITHKDEQRPINEVASSHMARRTFIGNLYKKVKDPNLICKLSGHSEGSKAFARYRDIDEEMKKELVNLLEKE